MTWFADDMDTGGLTREKWDLFVKRGVRAQFAVDEILEGGVTGYSGPRQAGDRGTPPPPPSQDPQEPA